MKDAILSFYRYDPIVAWLLTAFAAFLILGMLTRAFYRAMDWWADREMERQEEQRTRFTAPVKGHGRR